MSIFFSYNMVRSCYKPAAVKLYKKTNEEVKSVTRTILEVSCHSINQSQTEYQSCNLWTSLQKTS